MHDNLTDHPGGTPSEGVAVDGTDGAEGTDAGAGGDAFLELARQPSSGLVSEFVAFLGENKKWWLVPLLLGFAIVGALVAFGSSAAGPFVYTLF